MDQVHLEAFKEILITEKLGLSAEETNHIINAIGVQVLSCSFLEKKLKFGSQKHLKSVI